MSNAPARPPKLSLRVRARQGTMVSLTGQLLAQLLRLLANLLLSRLLFPEAFALMALVYLVMFGMEQILNLGVEVAVIRHERGDESRFLDTAWTLQVARGFLLWLGVCALAPLIARFYGEPELADLLPVASFAAVLMGSTSTKLFMLTRRLEPGRRVAIELAGQVAGLLFMVAIAWRHRSAWALVFGGLANQATITCLSHVWIPGRTNRFAWDAEARRDLLAFGRWVFASSGLSFVANQVDIALLGRLVPAAVLGVYSIGTMIPNLLRDVVGRLASSVLMPALSESNRESAAALRAGYAGARRVTLPLALLLALLAAVVAPVFFGYLYDSRYADAGWIAQLVLVRFWFGNLQVTACLALLALGDARTWMYSSAVGSAAVIAGCLLGFEIAELPGFLAGMALGTAMGYLVPAFRLLRLGVASPLPDLAYTVLGAGLAAAALGAARASESSLGIGDSGLRRLAVSCAVLAPFALWVAGRTLRELRAVPDRAVVRPGPGLR